MKRCSVNSRQFYGPLGNSMLNPRYKWLLEEYLQLQKENVSKKKKLQVEKQKRDVLLDEVRFLRQRHKYLTKLQFAEVEPELGPPQNVDIHDVSIMKEINYVTHETNTEQEGNGREELVWKTESTEKSVNFINSAKKSGKRKVSWQDQVALKA